ncbi:MAG: DUF1003 domain-containing protein [Alphaproteobacteria bacterium]|nr:DUF1003 domain-containing protein [Alphaproteobacteria bacterium]
MSLHAWVEKCEHVLGLGTDAASNRARRILKSVANRSIISRDVASEMDKKETFGEWLADRVATFGGSWTFIMAFGVFLVFWASVNTVVLITGAFDPYPFIFLNLMLSMLAALQAPIIMMSQNRQAIKDRAAAEHDYEVNLKAEIEIMALHEKLDQLRNEHLQQMLVQQSEQIKLLTQLLAAQGVKVPGSGG